MSTPNPAELRKRLLAAKQTTPQENSESPSPSQTTEKSQQRPTKKPYEPKPHLTQKPLSGNEALMALRDSLPQDKRQNHKGGRPPKFRKGHKPRPAK